MNSPPGRRESDHLCSARSVAEGRGWLQDGRGGDTRLRQRLDTLVDSTFVVLPLLADQDSVETVRKTALDGLPSML